ncbi:MAG: TRAP transporter large permease [Paracoccus sp. (in: a-proteobacteria)]|uniref:TRAP transporter large permease n=1 Tax=Paracoccus sp. TaxID=267 RepID=UPI0026E0E2ED|nr:TRAP transporter large permease [Paracoccus sp. (in: a-proteobacteria)]MDO5632372.1 TRAP transporter large permease [Paracoccus sp. (in: a-proteobacteria)]
MTPFLIFGALLVVLMMGIPVAFALGILGASLLAIKGLPLSMVASTLFGGINDFVLLAIPLFLLMSNLLLRGGIGRDLFVAMQAWVGHWPGGLGIAALLTCGVFSAISGSSVTTAATVGTVAIPEMIKRGYSRSLTLGLMAAGGTLGIIIPPSVPLIVYGAITEQSIGHLFLAGIGPGLLLIVLFGIYVVIMSAIHGTHQAIPRANWDERRVATWKAVPTLLLSVTILGGIYAGIVTPTEASGIGATLAFLILIGSNRLSRDVLIGAVTDTVKTTTVIFLIVIGAKIFGQAITLYQLPARLAWLFEGYFNTATLALLLIAVILIFIGFFLESMSMLLIMVPVLMPTVTALGIDPIWFGIFFVLLIEVALITPPVGLNLFVIQSLDKAPLGVVARGSLPFVAIMLFTVILLVIFPQIALGIVSFG